MTVKSALGSKRNSSKRTELAGARTFLSAVCRRHTRREQIQRRFRSRTAADRNVRAPVGSGLAA